MHTFCSSLTKFSSTKSVQTRFVAPQKLLVDTFLVIKVIISYGNFIAVDPMKKFGARFSFSNFHRQKFSRQQEPKHLNNQLTRYFLQYLLYKTCLSDPQMISSYVPIVEIKIVFLNETTYSKIVM